MSGLKVLLAKKAIAVIAATGLVAGAGVAYGVQAVVSGQSASFQLNTQSARAGTAALQSSGTSGVSDSTGGGGSLSGTTNYQTAKVSGSVSATVSGLPGMFGMLGTSAASGNSAHGHSATFGASGNGEIDLATREGEGAIQIDGLVGTLLGGAVQVRVVGNTAYVSAPVLAGLDGGKAWVAIPLPKSPASSKFPQFQSFYYTHSGGLLNILKPVSTSITKSGTATVNGHDTTVYKAVINVGSVAASMVPSGMVSQAQSLTRNLKATVYAYVGSSGLVRRITGSIAGTLPPLPSIFRMLMGGKGLLKLPSPGRPLSGTALPSQPKSPIHYPKLPIHLPKLPLPKLPIHLPKLPNTPVTMNVTASATFSSFGVSVNVAAPPASQTASISSVIASMMKMFNSFKGIKGTGSSGSGSGFGNILKSLGGPGGGFGGILKGFGGSAPGSGSSGSGFGSSFGGSGSGPF
ncbi:MAG: hypothetical protein ACYDGY_06390 [Acidimicrobiales bacterium]